MECEHGVEGEPCPDCIKEYHAEQAEQNSPSVADSIAEPIPTHAIVYLDSDDESPPEIFFDEDVAKDRYGILHSSAANCMLFELLEQ